MSLPEFVNCQRCNIKLKYFEEATCYESISDENLLFEFCRRCNDTLIDKIKSLENEFIQPERSKREDSQKCEMRCSEHCGKRNED